MDLKEIEHLAELSKLEFSEKELKQFSKEFESIVSLADTIKNADISGQKKFEIIDMNELREDNPKSSTPVEILLQNAPEQKKDSIVVPRVVE